MVTITTTVMMMRLVHGIGGMQERLNARIG